MRRVHDIRCVECGTVTTDVVVDSSYPDCVNCGGETTWMPSRINTDIWGSPKYIKSLDETFSTKSDLKSYLKEHHLEPAGDRVGGARNEGHLNLGKSFSYAGQPTRKTIQEGR